MSDQPAGTEDVQGHMATRPRADANQEQSEDVEGHTFRHVMDGQPDESEDVEGHSRRISDEAQDDAEDVEGHSRRISDDQ